MKEYHMFVGNQLSVKVNTGVLPYCLDCNVLHAIHIQVLLYIQRYLISIDKSFCIIAVFCKLDAM